MRYIKAVFRWLKACVNLKQRCLHAVRANRALCQSLNHMVQDYNKINKKNLTLRKDNEKAWHICRETTQQAGTLLSEIAWMRREQMNCCRAALRGMAVFFQGGVTEEFYQELQPLDPQGKALFEAVLELLGQQTLDAYCPGDVDDGYSFKRFADGYMFPKRSNKQVQQNYERQLWPLALEKTIASLRYEDMEQVPAVIERLCVLAPNQEPSFTLQKAG